MVKNGAKVMAYYCKFKKLVADGDCFDGKMEVDALKDVLLTSIQQLQAVLAKQKKAASEKAAVPSVDYVREIASLQREIEGLNREKLSLYNAYSDGDIDWEEYSGRRQSVDDRIHALGQQADELEQRSRQHRQSVAALPPAMEYLQDMAGLPLYDNELISALVKHVVVHNERQVEIVWKYADEVGNLMSGENGGWIWNSRS